MATYKGYTYQQTAITTTVRYQRAGKWLERPMRLYAIEGLKEAGQRPFLTSAQACRDYIDSKVEGLPSVRGDVPQRIKSARLRLSLTQQELGEALGYTGQTAIVAVSRWEAGTRPVPMDKLAGLADRLHLEIKELLP